MDLPLNTKPGRLTSLPVVPEAASTGPIGAAPDPEARRRLVLGLTLPAFGVTVERGRLRQFAVATGETDPVYSDLDAARAAGHRDLPAPLTYLFSLELQRPDPYLPVQALGVDLRQMLHGEQRFTYHALVYAGDELAMSPRVVDYHEKKHGELQFITRRTRVQRGAQLVGELENVLVIRSGR